MSNQHRHVMSRLAVEQEGPNWEGVDILSDIEDTSAMIETQMGEVYDLDRTGQIQASLLLDNLLADLLQVQADCESADRRPGAGQ